MAMSFLTSLARVARTYHPYLAKPAIWPEFGRRLSRRFGRGPLSRGKPATSEDRQAAEQWCSARALSTAEALIQLGAATAIDPAEAYHGVFREAESQVQRCPISMGGAGNLTLLHSLAEHLAAKTVIETGVAYGWSSLAILLSLRRHGHAASLYSVDLPYFELRSDPWVGCVVPDDLRSQWQLLRCADRDGLPGAVRDAGPVDLAHYDSDKSYIGRLWGYGILWRALRPGGLLVSDDVGDSTAFRSFAEQVAAQPIVVLDKEKYQGVLVKA